MLAKKMAKVELKENDIFSAAKNIGKNLDDAHK
jgi:hypothetical protein